MNSSSPPLEAAASLLRQTGDRVLCLSTDEFWRSFEKVADEPAPGCSALEGARDGEIVLGFLGRSHLGDVVCMSRLVRLLTTAYRCRVLVVRHRSVYTVLENNPFLAGYRNEARIPLSQCARGTGHMIQKLERSFGLEVDPFPRGEIYLSHEELQWAWKMRAVFPRRRPLALVSVSSITDNRIAPTADSKWQRWVHALTREFTVVQLALTDIRRLEETVRLHEINKETWRPGPILDDCLVLENLSTREFFAMFAVADLYLGPNSGGAHVAAAFHVPSIIVLSERQYGRSPSFPDRVEGSRWRHESFLYPYHWFLVHGGAAS